MIKPILAISFCALFTVSCGGGGGGTTTGGGGTDGGGTTGGGTTGGGGTTPPAGPAPSFGDNADASNGLSATSTVCPASVTGSFTGWAKNGANWCVYKCPPGFENDDNDHWGFFTSNQNACRDTSASAGDTVSADIFTPDGERIYISNNANPANDSAYNCASFEYNQTTRVWGQIASPAPFTLRLSADNSAVDAGTNTTWSFASGVLTLESGRVMTNVSVGDGAFSSWQSNTALIRCST